MRPDIADRQLRARLLTEATAEIETIAQLLQPFILYVQATS
jgi:hypothetical protein